jgi:eukaryotic-like serine/threonine-protein kinase
VPQTRAPQTMTLINRLNTLETAGLIRFAAARPELEYLFRHALVQDAAYAMLLKQDRKQLHLAVGEALEQLYPEQRDEQAATLAYHFEKAGARDKAAHYFRRAGNQARAGYANAEAIAFYQAALEQLQAPAGRDGAVEAAQLHECLGDVLGLTGRYAEALAAYQQARTQIPSPKRMWEARLQRKTGNILVAQYQLAEAGQAYDRAALALDIKQSETEVALWQEWIQIQIERNWLCYLRDSAEEIAKLVEQTRAAVDKFGTPAQRSRLFEGLLLIALRRDRYTISDETLAYVEAALAAAKQTDSLSVIARAQGSLGFVLLWRGELDGAENNMLAGQSLSERIGDVSQQAINLTYLSVLYRKRGQVAECERYTRRSLAVASESRMLIYIAAAKANLAWLAWRAGDLAETQAQAPEALKIWQELKGLFPFQWMALWPLLATSLTLGQIQEAIEYARALLAPVQQRLTEAVTASLEAALRASEQDETETARALLARAVEQAQADGYL